MGLLFIFHSIHGHYHTRISSNVYFESERRGSKFELRPDDDDTDEANAILGSFDATLLTSVPTGSASSQDTAIACLRKVRVGLFLVLFSTVL